MKKTIFALLLGITTLPYIGFSYVNPLGGGDCKTKGSVKAFFQASGENKSSYIAVVSVTGANHEGEILLHPAVPVVGQAVAICQKPGDERRLKVI